MIGKTILFVLIILLLSCQDKKGFQEDNFSGFTKSNDSIFPFGTYTRNAYQSAFQKAVFFVDSTQFKLSFIDSSGTRKDFSGEWSLKSVDTQFFDLPKPFAMAYFGHNNIAFMDSTILIEMEKISDTMVKKRFKELDN